MTDLNAAPPPVLSGVQQNWALRFFARAFNATLVLLLISLASHAADVPGKRVLILGDSHLCGPTGQRLFETMQARGLSVSLYCGVSSAANHWVHAKAPGNFKCQKRNNSDTQLSRCQNGGDYLPLQDILNQGPFDLALVGLGTNSLLYKQIDKDYVDLAKKISIRAKTCRWIGPPHLREDQRRGYRSGAVAKLESRLDMFYTSLAELNTNCPIIDSRAGTAKGLSAGETTDGIHRTQAAGTAWADLIVNEIFP